MSCPNCHEQFQRGTLAVHADLTITAAYPGHPLEGQKLTVDPRHGLNLKYLRYHWETVFVPQKGDVFDKPVHYAQYLREHLPIASGVVEAACKTLVTQRMKRSGMAWTPAGGQAILTLRRLIQSGRWERAWACSVRISVNL